MKTIKNRIIKQELIEWRKVKYFKPDKLLTSEKSTRAKFKKALTESGFLLPFIVWQMGKNDVVFLEPDIRELVMKELLDEGVKIPEKLPASFIECKNEKEAKKIILLLASRYSEFNKKEFLDFFSDIDIESILDTINLPDLNIENLIESSQEIIEDEVETPSLTAISKPGDIWRLGHHRLLCGDSTNPEHISILMQKKRAHLLFTDPPYNVNYAEFNKNVRGSKKNWTESYCNQWKDSMSDEKYKDFLVEMLKNARDNLIETAHYYIFYASIYQFVLMDILSSLEIPFDSVPLIWKKQTMPISWARYKRTYEPFLFAGRNSATGSTKNSRWFGGNAEKNVWDIDADFNGHYIHPTQKPVAIPARAITNSSKAGEIVLELFGGSGSTLIACEQLNRTCYANEFEPAYVDGIVHRYVKFKQSHKDVFLETGKKQIPYSKVFPEKTIKAA